MFIKVLNNHLPVNLIATSSCSLDLDIQVSVSFSDCRATAHPECKDFVALPCIPTTSTPTSAKTPGGVRKTWT